MIDGDAVGGVHLAFIGQILFVIKKMPFSAAVKHFRIAVTALPDKDLLRRKLPVRTNIAVFLIQKMGIGSDHRYLPSVRIIKDRAFGKSYRFRIRVGAEHIIDLGDVAFFVTFHRDLFAVRIQILIVQLCLRRFGKTVVNVFLESGVIQRVQFRLIGEIRIVIRRKRPVFFSLSS